MKKIIGRLVFLAFLFSVCAESFISITYAALPSPIPAGTVTVGFVKISTLTQATGFTYGGTWADSTVGGRSINTVAKDSWCQWKPTDLASDNQEMSRGLYDIYYYNPYRPSGWDNGVVIDIVTNVDGFEVKKSTSVEQQYASGTTSDYVNIGRAFFGGTGQDYVKLTKITASSVYTQAADIKFIPVASANEPSLALVNLQGNTDAGIKQLSTTYIDSDVINVNIPRNFYDAAKNPVKSLNFKFVSALAGNYTITHSTLGSSTNSALDMTIDEATLQGIQTGIVNFGTVTIKDTTTNTEKVYQLKLQREGEPVIIDDYCPDGNPVIGGKQAYEIVGGSTSSSPTVPAAPEVLAMSCSHTDTNHKYTHKYNFSSAKINLMSSVVPTAGFYELWAWNSRQTDTTDIVLDKLGVNLKHNGTSSYQVVKYDSVPQRWVKVGTYYFKADGTETIDLLNATSKTGTINFRSPTMKLIPMGLDSTDITIDSINVKVGSSAKQYTLADIVAANNIIKVPYYTTAFDIVVYGRNQAVLKINDNVATLNASTTLKYSNDMIAKIEVGAKTYNIQFVRENPPTSIVLSPVNFGMDSVVTRDGSLGGWYKYPDSTSFFGGGLQTTVQNVAPAKLSFNIPQTGNYKIYARVRDQNDTANRRFTVKIDSYSEDVCYTKPASLGATLTWYWDSIPRSGSSLSLTAGWHTVELSNPAVSHCKFDGIVIVKDGTTFDTNISSATLLSMTDTAAPVFSAEALQYSVTNTSVNIGKIPSATDSTLVEYAIYRKTGAQSYSKVGAIASTQELTFVDNNLAPGTTYSYFIRAYDAYGQYVDTAEFTATTSGILDVEAPTWQAGSAINIDNAGYTSATISWQPANDNIGILGYNIYKGSVSQANLLTTTQNTSYVISNLIAGSQTNIIIEAFDASNNKTETLISKIIETKPQIFISPQATDTADSHIVTFVPPSGTFSISNGVKGYLNNNTLYSGTQNCYAQWNPNITKAGYYDVKLYRPIYVTSDPAASGVKVIEAEIVADGKTILVSKDWKTGTSGWVDFGSYYFSASSIGSQYIKIKKTTSEPSALRADYAEFSYVDVSDNDSSLSSIILDKEQIFNIDKTQLKTTDYEANINIIPVAKNKDAVIKINGEIVSSHSMKAVLNDKKFKVIKINVQCGSSQTNYDIFVNRSILIDELAPEVTPVAVSTPGTNVWVTSGLTGSRGSSIYTNQSNFPVRYPVNKKGTVTVKGNTEVWVYNVISAEDASKQDKNLGIRVKTGSASEYLTTIDQTTLTGTPGWIKVGNFNFSGLQDGSEYVEIYRLTNSTATVRAAEVLFVNVDPLYIENSTLKMNGGNTDAISGAGNYSAAVDVYNKTGVTGTISLVFAVYNSNGALYKIVLKDETISEFGLKNTINTDDINLTSEQSETYSYKIFTFDSIGNLRPLN